jgi:hypothetical protein
MINLIRMVSILNSIFTIVFYVIVFYDEVNKI